MGRYFYDTCDPHGIQRDLAGDYFDNVEEAVGICRQLLLDLLYENLLYGDHHVVTCDVRDEAGRIVYRGRLTFEGVPEPA